MTMVARVARIVCNQINMRDYRGDPNGWRHYVDNAVEIIAAMREPTVAMAERAAHRWIDGDMPKTEPPLFALGYQTMIDAALEEK